MVPRFNIKIVKIDKIIPIIHKYMTSHYTGLVQALRFDNMWRIREYRKGNQKWTSRETGNIGYTRRRKTQQKHNTICIGHHYTETNTNNVNKT